MARTTTNGWLGTRVALAAAALVAGGALVASTSTFSPAMAWAEEAPAAEQGQDGGTDGTTGETTYDNTTTTITGSYYLASAESIVRSLQASNAQLVESDALVTQAQKRAAQCAAAGIHSAQNENECVAYLAAADVQNPVTDVATMTQNWFVEGSALLNTAYNYVGTALFQAENGDLYLVAVFSTDAGTTGTEGKVEPIDGSGMQDETTEVPVTVTVTVEGTSEQPAAEDGIEPQAEAGKCTFTIQANGGTGNGYTEEVNIGINYQLPNCIFYAPQGKHFIGYKVEGNDTIYQPGSIIPINGDTIVNAQWASNTATFDANGGEGTMDSITAGDDGYATLPECTFTAPEGKQFKCWSTSNEEPDEDEDDDVTYAAGDAVTFTDGQVLYAIWEDVPATQYTLTYDANGGEGAMDSVDYDEGTVVTLADNAFTAPEGKQFKGWATSADGTEPVTSVTIAENTTVYAIWEDVPTTQYTLTYDANGGEGTMDSVDYDEGTEVTLADCGFTAPEGKQFKGWATSSDGAETVTSVTMNGETTVYAIWEDVAKAQVTAYYDANGGSGEMGNIVVDEGDSATLSTCGFTAPEGKQFKCWSTDPEGQTTYNAGDSIAVTDGMKIYAIWEDAPKTQVTVTFDANGGEGTMDAVTVDQGTTVTLPTNTFTRSGYTFAGWNTQADGNGSSYVNGGSVTLGANLTLYAKWTTEKYITGIQNNLKATTTAGVKPTLPATASIRWSDGSTTSEAVTWTEPENYAAKYAQAGTFQVSGTVKGYSIKCTVTVNAASSNGTSGTTNNGGTTNGTTTDATAQNANGTATAQDQSALAKTGDSTDYTPIAIAGGVGLVVVILAVVLILKSRKSN